MRKVAFLCGILILCQVQSQLLELVSDAIRHHINRQLSLPNLIATSVRNEVINQVLEQAVQEIVHRSALPNQELRDLATTMGRSPRTKEERQQYVTVMKKIARDTPLLVAEYVKVKEHSNGTYTTSVNYLKMEADVVRRAIRYAERSERRRNGNSRTTSTPVTRGNML